MTTAATLSTSPPAKPGRGLRQHERTLGIVMLAPALTYIALLVALPFLLAVVLSFTNSSAGSLDVSFVGLQNFRSVIQSGGFELTALAFCSCGGKYSRSSSSSENFSGLFRPSAVSRAALAAL